MSEKTKLYYTFGNHMHWVDMEWLWGYHVLPGSVRDMLHFCRETGTKGNVNFDGVGYEKLAAENPEALFELRSAVSSGDIEPVGCSYGQPYGLFHGGESNVRQRIYGARSVRRLLGVWPRTFWEEEFDFFPQLPQILKGCGFTGASLFFQWTWHTPEVPREDVPVIWWEGTDGTRIKTTTRNRLNLHQWPEDVDTMLADVAAHGVGERPLVQQWLELMPSPDWMCRSEVLLPKMKELLADERFDVSPVTLGEYLEASPDDVPVRRYQMDDVWHGLTLGKNFDDLRVESASTEALLLDAEVLASIASVLGRPYAQWDVYPTWELEEAWRHLLMAQHHDNDECEGLCGHVGKEHYRIASNMAQRIYDTVYRRFYGENSVWPVANTFGWRTLDHEGNRTILPYSILQEDKIYVQDQIVCQESSCKIVAEALDIEFDAIRGGFTQFGDLLSGQSVGQLCVGFEPTGWELIEVNEDDFHHHDCVYRKSGKTYSFSVYASGLVGGGVICFNPADMMELLSDLKPGFKDCLTIRIPIPFEHFKVLAGHPYSVEEVTLGSIGHRKYPEGDWMTSTQWFEDIEGAFTGQNFVNVFDATNGEGILICYKGTKQWFVRDGELHCVICANDTWDGEYFKDCTTFQPWSYHNFDSECRIDFVPHVAMPPSEKFKIAMEHVERPFDVMPDWDTKPKGELRDLSFCDISNGNVIVTALYRETEDYSGRHLDNYAGHVLAERIFGDIQPDQSRVYPFVMRLVEFDDITGEIELTICGEVSSVFKTNLLGQVETELKPEPIEDSPCKHPHTGKATKIRVPMRGKEIATLYFDIVEGRKQTRDLDAKREIWAQVHRIED